MSMHTDVLPFFIVSDDSKWLAAPSCLWYTDVILGTLLYSGMKSNGIKAVDFAKAQIQFQTSDSAKYE